MSRFDGAKLPNPLGDASADGGGLTKAGPNERAFDADGGRAGAARLRRRRPIPPKLYRIGELVAYSGMSRQTIHNYTTMGLLVESRWSDGGHRLWDESVFERLDMIAEFKAQRKSLETIRRHFARQDEQ